MKIGDIVRQKINVGAPPGNGLPPRMAEKQTGTVVYIHPEGRFYVVRLDFLFGSFRESYFFPEREGNPDASRHINEPKEGKHLSTKKW